MEATIFTNLQNYQGQASKDSADHHFANNNLIKYNYGASGGYCITVPYSLQGIGNIQTQSTYNVYRIDLAPVTNTLMGWFQCHWGQKE